MSSEPPQFEVHCRSCEVSFPVGTRHCIHCGGATTSQPESRASNQFEFGAVNSNDLEPAWDDAMPFRGFTEKSEADAGSTMEGQLAPLDQAGQATESAGPGRSILRSLGSLIWIALLIAFSLSGRTCGD